MSSPRTGGADSRFQTLVRALPDVVSRIRDDGLVLDFHVPSAFATEFPAEDLIGQRLQDVIPADIAARFARAVADIRGTGGAVSYDYQVEAEGKVRHREVRVVSSGPDEVLSMLRDVTDLRDNQQALERSRAELRALAAHLQDIREEERTRLSREVHDVLGQQLTAIRLGAGWFGRRLAGDAEAQERLAALRATIDETIVHVRQIASDLRPGVLDDFGIASAAEWQTKRFEERTEIECRLDVQGAAEPPPDVATAAFRVLQESLTNVARHAHADAVAVTLVLGPDAVRLVVADDGRGFDDHHRPPPVVGVGGDARARRRPKAARLEVSRGALVKGTVVECTLPFDPRRT